MNQASQWPRIQDLGQRNARQIRAKVGKLWRAGSKSFTTIVTEGGVGHPVAGRPKVLLEER